MSDLDRLREIAGVVRPPAFEELQGTRRRRARRTRLASVGAVAVAGLAIVGAWVATGQTLRTEPPPVAPSPSPSPSPSAVFEIPAGQQTITPDIGPGDVKGIPAVATVTNAQPAHRADTSLTASVTVHSDSVPVEYYCRSHDVPTWIAYAEGDLVGDGSGGAHDWWNIRPCRPDDPTTFTLQRDLEENTFHREESKTVSMFAMAPPSQQLRDCLAKGSGYCPMPAPLAATDAEFGFRIWDFPTVPPVLRLLENYEFEALTSIRGTGWLLDRAVLPAPGSDRLAFELPASSSEYVVDVYAEDGAHMQRCVERHADELPDQEPFTAYLAARDKICGVELRLVVDGTVVSPARDPQARGHFRELGARLSAGVDHQIVVEVAHGDPRNIGYAAVVRVATEMP